MKHIFPLSCFIGIVISVVHGCLVDSVCYNDADCPENQVCEILTGDIHGQCRDRCQDDGDCPPGSLCDPVFHTCQTAECQTEADCAAGFLCENGRCVSKEPLVCPSGMVAVEEQFCMDLFESSRPDATLMSAGLDSSMATSRPNVLPWQVENNAQALGACVAAGKSLCTEQQWYLACSGSTGTIYSYGDAYDPPVCNGIDTYCDCTAGGSCGDETPCPFAGCYHTCGAAFRLDPTGAHPGCVNVSGVFDLNGNLWEHVLDGDGTRVRGGAYNCSDSETLHRCDYVPTTWTPSALGFRCCSQGIPPVDGEQ